MRTSLRCTVIPGSSRSHGHGLLVTLCRWASTGRTKWSFQPDQANASARRVPISFGGPRNPIYSLSTLLLPYDHLFRVASMSIYPAAFNHISSKLTLVVAHSPLGPLCLVRALHLLPLPDPRFPRLRPYIPTNPFPLISIHLQISPAYCPLPLVTRQAGPRGDRRKVV